MKLMCTFERSLWKILPFLFVVLFSLVACKRHVNGNNYAPLLIQTHDNYIKDISLSPNGKFLASVSSDSHLKVFESKTLKELSKIKSESNGLLAVTFSPDGNTIAISDIAGGIEVYETATYTSAKTLTPHSNEIVSLAFSHDGQYLAAASKDGSISVTGIADYQNVFTHKSEDPQNLPSHVAFTSDNQHVVASIGRKVAIFSVPNWKLLKEFEVDGQDFPIYGLAVSPDGETVATSTHVLIQLWEIPSGDEIRTIHGHFGRVTSLAFSPNGDWLASGGGVQYFDSLIKLWDVDNGEQLAEVKAHKLAVSSLAFSPDSKFLYSGSWDEHIGVIEVERALDN